MNTGAGGGGVAKGTMTSRAGGEPEEPCSVPGHLIVSRGVWPQREGAGEGSRGGGVTRVLPDSVFFHYADFHFHFDWIRFGFVLVSIEFNSIAGNEASSYPPSLPSLSLSPSHTIVNIFLWRCCRR